MTPKESTPYYEPKGIKNEDEFMQVERDLIRLYKSAHNYMRNIDGLQPQEALDELMKYLFVKQLYEQKYGYKKQLPAKKIKIYFKKFLKDSKIFSGILWQDYKIHLSNNCLELIHKLFYNLNFNHISFDLRSSALAEFMDPDIRKGLGIFLTPSSVVKMMINYINPNIKSKILDPACGSGTFLIEALKFFKTKNKKSNKIFRVFGFDKNPKMLLLAKLNLSHIKNVIFESKLIDTINYSQKKYYDLIVTNPPFGVSIDSKNYNFNSYKTCQNEYGYSLKTQTSEIVFIEKCLKLLKPSGTLAIVIPKSIVTNNNLQKARSILSNYGYIEAIINLPPETFTLSGTQTATSILFIKKYKNKKEALEYSNVVIGNILNTGYDLTGRKKNGEQLSVLPTLMKKCLENKESKNNVCVKKNIRKSDTFKEVSSFFTINNNIFKNKGLQLVNLCHDICIGKTPARNAYSNSGTFILKVGNLTGSGINWEARDRNYVSESETKKRKNSKRILLLKKHDILLTASAHNISYIAKKSDMFLAPPHFISNPITFVGEVMLLRPNTKKINPYLLLAFLKHPETIKRIQSMVRGQTAHLYPHDLGQLIIPNKIIKNKNRYQEIIDLTEEALNISGTLNTISFKRSQLLNNLSL